MFAPIKRIEPNLYLKTKVKDNILYIDCAVDSYLAADIADFIRQKLLDNNISFTYETVMSHKGKIDFMLNAKSKGYQVYLYYIATASPDINVERVNIRAAQNGHFVAPITVRNRYYKILENLKSAISASDTCYIWDNSKLFESVLISKITNGNNVEMFETENVSVWFEKYVLG
ncbi:MAG: zeta toxin family protein [Flavobacterium sp.]|nr:zeta toxin family protein [Flavobacterium sp.]